MALKNPRSALCFILSFLLSLLSCSPTPTHPSQTSLYLYRITPPAFLELSSDFQPVKEIPFSLPRSCSLFDVYPAPVGKFLLAELSCPNGQTVLFVDTESGAITQPVVDSDAHYLSWAGDGGFVYLKVDSFGDTHVVRAYPNGKQQDLEIPGWTYDLSFKPGSNDYIFSFSRGLGTGSELHLARGSGRNSQPIYQDPLHYISFARYSPDGSMIAFIKVPDTSTPFTVGELWVMDADGSDPHKLADVDAGHGYAANWSPNGRWIAFVKRENIRDESADQTSESLISNIYLVNVLSGEMQPGTNYETGRAETPHWSPDGNTLAFHTVLDGRMEVWITDIATGNIQALITEPACCPAWLQK